MVPSKTRAAMTKNQEFVIVTAMKNEGPYILEWVAHHLAIGFGHFIVVTNDCADGTDEILLALQRQGLVAAPSGFCTQMSMNLSTSRRR
jgi:hypothetical protein